jgi:predicted transcriptional regulator
MTQKKLATLLERCGYRRLLAGTLSYLIVHPEKPLTAKELERGIDARQPEISIALAQLKEKGWITESTVEAEEGKKGRPTFAYCVISVEKLYEQISAERMKEVTEIGKTLTELKVAMIPAKIAVPVESSTKKEQQLNLL